MLTLTACSSAPQQQPLDIRVAPQALTIVHPPLPAPVKLSDPKWQECQDEQGHAVVCLSPKEASKELRNKIAVGRWMSSMGGVVSYYRSLGNDGHPLTVPVPAQPTK